MPQKDAKKTQKQFKISQNLKLFDAFIEILLVFFFKEHQKCVSHVDGLQKTVIAFMLFFSSHVYLTHTRKICYNNANNNTHISIFCDRHVCHSSLTSFGTLLQVYAYTRYNFYIEYAIMQEKEKRERRWMHLFLRIYRYTSKQSSYIGRIHGIDYLSQTCMIS